MEIEKAQFERDYKTLVNFQLDMAMESEGLQLDKDILSAGVQSVFNDENKGIYYVARESEQTIGSLLTMSEWSDWRNAKVLWVHSVYISPEFRRQGVYTKMYQHLREMVQNSNEYKGIRLYVDKSNHSAIKTYQNLEMNNDHYDLFEWMV